MTSMTGYARCEVSMHCTPDDCWIILSNFVYDVTDFLDQHPGGAEILLEFAGGDATDAFESVGHSAHARLGLAKFRVGELLAHDRDDFLAPEYISQAKILLSPTN